MNLKIGDFVKVGVSTNLYRVIEIRLGKTAKGKYRSYDIYWNVVVAEDPSRAPFVLNHGLYNIPKVRFPEPLSQEEVIRSIFLPRKQPVFDFVN
jgi:hypothetical protein